MTRQSLDKVSTLTRQSRDKMVKATRQNGQKGQNGHAKVSKVQKVQSKNKITKDKTMNNYPINYRITFFIKGNDFNIGKRYDEYAAMFSEKYQCNVEREYIPLILPNMILRQMVATFTNTSRGISVKIQEGRVDINIQKTSGQVLSGLREKIVELLDIYTQIFNGRNDLVMYRVACCSTYLFDGDEEELNKCYKKIVNDFGEDSPIEWTIQRISRIYEYGELFPTPITNNTLIKRLNFKGRFEENAHNRILAEIDLNSFPQDVSFDPETIIRFFTEMPNQEEKIYTSIQRKLLQ